LKISEHRETINLFYLYEELIPVGWRGWFIRR